MAMAMRDEDEFEVSTDRARMNVDLIHAYLSDVSYWAQGISRERLTRALDHSLCFGVFERSGGEQVGFARVTTDYATVAYLADVFVAPTARGQGLGKLLVRSVLAHPELQGLRRWLLATKDAHGLYTQVGFRSLSDPARFMELFRPDAYLKDG
jgi:GNAT superfamily N-acetyltransferase